MKTFFNILQTIVNIKNKTYPTNKIITNQNKCEMSDYDNELKIYIRFLMKTIMKLQQTHKHKDHLSKNAISKFTALSQILENNIMRKELKEKVIESFIKTQKYNNAFIRLAHIYRLKKHQYVVKCDLYMNPLDMKHKNTFVLVEYETKTNYLFNINDIINIIESSISNSPNFFSQPIWPANPYNNQPFNISTLYNIYYQVKNSNRVMPILLHLFFLENFNKNKFSEQNEATIREYSIKKYVFNSHYSILYEPIMTMIKQNYFTKKLLIDASFPKELLVNIFRPFLFHYFMTKYYINETFKIYECEQLLNYKLKKFYQFNKAFGRKYYKVLNTNKNATNIKIKIEKRLNTKHITFYNIKHENDNSNINTNDNASLLLDLFENFLISNR